MGTLTIQIRKKGTITLPAKFRRKYNLEEGKVLEITDIGDGVFMLSPYTAGIDDIADEIAASLRAEGETLESMMQTLHEVREEYATKES